jgi:acyl dehydratase
VLYYEDLEPGVSRELGSHSVSRQEIVEFATKWDPQPFHIDEASAAESLFRGLTASSCHTYSLTGLISAQNPDHKVVALAMLGTHLEFPAPVRPDDLLTLRSECTEKRISRSRPGVGVARTRTTLINQTGGVALVMDSTFLVAMRSAPEDGGASGRG